MPCKCKERRAKLLALREKRRKKGRHVQAAALGAVLAVTEAVGKVSGVLPKKEEGEFAEAASRAIAHEIDAGILSEWKRQHTGGTQTTIHGEVVDERDRREDP